MAEQQNERVRQLEEALHELAELAASALGDYQHYRQKEALVSTLQDVRHQARLALTAPPSEPLGGDRKAESKPESELSRFLRENRARYDAMPEWKRKANEGLLHLQALPREGDAPCPSEPSPDTVEVRVAPKGIWNRSVAAAHEFIYDHLKGAEHDLDSLEHLLAQVIQTALLDTLDGAVDGDAYAKKQEETRDLAERLMRAREDFMRESMLLHQLVAAVREYLDFWFDAAPTSGPQIKAGRELGDRLARIKSQMVYVPTVEEVPASVEEVTGDE